MGEQVVHAGLCLDAGGGLRRQLVLEEADLGESDLGLLVLLLQLVTRQLEALGGERRLEARRFEQRMRGRERALERGRGLFEITVGFI